MTSLAKSIIYSLLIAAILLPTAPSFAKAKRHAKAKVSSKLARPMPVAKAAFANAATMGAIEISEVITEDQKLGAVFKFVFDNEAEKYGWPANYKSLWCPSNIFNLVRRLDEANVDLSNANVWYIFPQASVNGGRGESAVHPKLARHGQRGPTNEWSFHVVLEVDGKILDLDYTDRPRLVSRAEYGATMWQKGASVDRPDAQPLFARVIPAKDYLNSYTGNWSWYLAGGAGRYAVVDFASLLKN